ncbi:MAG: hypothetical protein EON50_20930 [Acidovorax sp.]|nr:MAG: hypothetical protein EON50_20930 [Acidovorax sp.]
MNTTAYRVHHGRGGDFSDGRNARATQSDEAVRSPMHGRRQLGLDYTPLFRFLISKVGAQWDGVYSEALARLDRPDPIFWLVARRPHERRRYVLVGESSYYNGLYVDDAGVLQLVDRVVGPSSLVPKNRRRRSCAANPTTVLALMLRTQTGDRPRFARRTVVSPASPRPI